MFVIAHNSQSKAVIEKKKKREIDFEKQKW